MTCHNCLTEMVKAGLGRNKVQRFKCQQCGKRFSEPQQKPFGADVRLPASKVEMILHCLVEGNSVRSTARLCDVEKRTVLNMLLLAGENCERLLENRIRNVPVKDVQCDEIWTFCGVKQGHLRARHDESKMGDQYTFIAIERHTNSFSRGTWASAPQSTRKISFRSSARLPPIAGFRFLPMLSRRTYARLITGSRIAPITVR